MVDGGPDVPALSTLSIAVIGHAHRSKRATYAALSLHAPGESQARPRSRTKSSHSAVTVAPCLVQLNRSSRFVEHLGSEYEVEAGGCEKDHLAGTSGERVIIRLMDVEHCLAELTAIDSTLSNLERAFRSITALSTTLAARPATRPDTPLTTASLRALAQTTSFAAPLLATLPGTLHGLVKRAPVLAGAPAGAVVTCGEVEGVWHRLAGAGQRLEELMGRVRAGEERESDEVEVAKLRLAARVRAATSKAGEGRVAQRMREAIDRGRESVNLLQADEADQLAFRWAVERPWTELGRLLPPTDEMDWLAHLLHRNQPHRDDYTLDLPRLPSLTARLRHLSTTLTDTAIRTARRVSPFTTPEADGFVAVPLDSPDPASPGDGADEEASLWGEKVQTRRTAQERRGLGLWGVAWCIAAGILVCAGVGVGLWALVERARREGGVQLEAATRAPTRSR